MQKKLLTTAQVFEYVFSFIHMFICALFFSVRNNIYVMFLVFAVLSLVLGLYTETLKFKMAHEENKCFKVHLTIITVLSVVSCPACLFNLLGLLNTEESQTLVVVNPNYKPKEKKEHKGFFKPIVIVSIVALALIIVTSIIGNVYETTVGTVEVIEMKLTSEETKVYNEGSDNALNGVNYSITDPNVSVAYTIYKPKTASPTNPLPVVFVVPGFTRTKSTMTQYAIELSKRGAIVFVIDPGSQ